MFKEIYNLNVYYMDTDEKIPLNVELTKQEKDMCDANTSEIIIYYLLNPNLFFSHLYETITTRKWKFYLFNKDN